MRREIVAGLLLGSILGAIGFVRIAAWTAVADLYGPHWFLVGVTVSLSLVGVVLWGTLTGSMLPFLLESAGLRPGHLIGPIRRDPGRRHRPDHLFHRRQADPSRHGALNGRHVTSKPTKVLFVEISARK